MKLLGRIVVGIVTDFGKIAVLTVAGVGALIALFLVYIFYASFSPHLLLNPLPRDLMASPSNPEHPSSSLPVTLVPTYFPPGLSLAELDAATSRAGFSFEHQDDDPPSRTYKAGGRSNWACGEEFTLRFGLADGRVVDGVGYSNWTCL